MSQFDWPALMRAGMQGLRLTPEQFWRLTPAELRLMLGQGGAQAPLNRSGLDALMAAWPDGAGAGVGAGEKGECDD
ncbi:phage tail assembly chaperone [Seohaeicola saemankumensis]|nr:rcc01693 family protein [Seohaeicola saemankumensis]MCA0873652.1 phage tail assembly chaperone [Seohaeicola saemankumensis]